MRIAICGSLHLADRILEVQTQLKKHGHEAVIPESIEKFSLRSAKDTEAFKANKEHHMSVKPAAMWKYFDEIARSDAILVVNEEKKGISNYVGGNTFAEVIIAFYLGKKIFFMNPLPEHERLEAFREELESIKPVIIHGDLDKIR